MFLHFISHMVSVSLTFVNPHFISGPGLRPAGFMSPPQTRGMGQSPPTTDRRRHRGDWTLYTRRRVVNLSQPSYNLH